MSKKPEYQPRAWVGWAVFGGALVAVFALGMLYSTIMERRHEARIQPPLQAIDRFESDSSAWAVNWPREYETFQRTSRTDSETLFGGSAPRDYLEETPENVILFAGMAFAVDYWQARGHYYALEDVKTTPRLAEDTPATCWTCKTADAPRLMAELGKQHVDDPDAASLQELALAGAADFYGHNFHDFHDEMNHTVGCLDCHEPDTMRLRISRPALIEAFEAQGKDIKDVSHQEMRSLVCAQCHVEYYFRGENDYLVLPWTHGTRPEDMERHFDDYGFTDWTHAISGAPMIKMQHPDYELYSTGIHAYRNVSCADCHMPYRTEGGVKFTDHHMQTPLENIANSCQICHRWSEREIRDRVYAIQSNVKEGRGRAEKALALAHFDAAACIEIGASDEELEPIRQLIRQAQLRWDYVAAAKGMGFHSPGEAQRLLTAAVEMAQQARVEAARVLARHGYTDDVVYPDFSTKEKAQELDQRFRAGDPPSLLSRTTASTKPPGEEVASQ